MNATSPPARLKTRYLDEIRPALIGRFGYSSVMQTPRLEKITLNMGVGMAKTDSKTLKAAQEQLATIAGQHPSVRRARKSIAAFKLREGNPVGVAVTLRGERGYEFLDRLISIAIPRIRDFRGLNPRSFDGRGNYSLGVREQIIFPEIDYDAIDEVRGLDVTITTSASTDLEAFALLSAFGMPFARQGRPKAFDEVAADSQAAESGARRDAAVQERGEEPAAQEAVAEEAAAQEAVAEEAALEEVVAEQAAVEEAVAEEAAVEEAVAEEAAVEEAVAEEAALEQVVSGEAPVQEAVLEEAVVEEPALQEAVAEEPALEEVVAEQAVAEQAASEQPASEESKAEEPAGGQDDAIEEASAPGENRADEDTAETKDGG